MKCLLNALHDHNSFSSVQNTSKARFLSAFTGDRFVIGKNAKGFFPASVSTDVAISNYLPTNTLLPERNPGGRGRKSSSESLLFSTELLKKQLICIVPFCPEVIIFFLCSGLQAISQYGPPAEYPQL